MRRISIRRRLGIFAWGGVILAWSRWRIYRVGRGEEVAILLAI